MTFADAPRAVRFRARGHVYVYPFYVPYRRYNLVDRGNMQKNSHPGNPLISKLNFFFSSTSTLYNIYNINQTNNRAMKYNISMNYFNKITCTYIILAGLIY